MNITEKDCPEFTESPAEIAKIPDEFDRTDISYFSKPNSDKEFDSSAGEPDTPVVDDSKKKKHQQNFLLQYAAIALSVVIVGSSFGIDILGEDRIFSSSPSTEISSPDISGPIEQTGSLYPDTPPHLTSNLYPNEKDGNCFISVQTDSENESYIKIDASYREATPVTIAPGVTYDGKMNTIILENADYYGLVINDLGGTLSIEIRGNNTLERLIIYGWYYCGAVTFTGNGSLTINKDLDNPYGIVLDAEFSPSFLYVQSGPTLKSYGYSSAIAISHTTVSRPFILSSDMEVIGGTLTQYEDTNYFSTLGNNEGNLYNAYDFTFGFSDGTYDCVEIIIQPK